MRAIKVKIEITKVEDLFSILHLEEDCVYKVAVKIKASNPEHIAFLFTGFKNGNYCYIYNNTYDGPVSIDEIYSIKKIKKLAYSKRKK